MREIHLSQYATKHSPEALLPAATKLGQGNVFTGVCDSVHRVGVSASVHAGADTPQSRHPLEQQPPRSRHPPRADTSPWEQTPHPEQTPPPGSRPPGKQTTAYGQRAAGTHPTGMHSCASLSNFYSSIVIYSTPFSVFTLELYKTVKTSETFVKPLQSF